jgi:hypothetical protein
MLGAERWGVGWAAVLALAACGGDDGRAQASASNSGITVSGTDGETESGTATAGEASDTEGTGEDTEGECPPARACGDACCEQGEACIDDMCVVDCGGEAPCGADQICCDSAAGEVCYVGQCVVPGGSCSGLACATQVESECEQGQLCDADLGLCVPNLGDPTCAFEPEVGVFDPVPRFTWGVRAARPCSDGCQVEEVCNAATQLCDPTWPHVNIAMDDLPDYHQVVMSPMVADLDHDCVPEIVFNTYRNSAYTTDGVLRAIRGDDGSKVWTVTDPDYRTDPSSHPGIGDITGDGVPEVIVQGQGSYLLAFGNDGTPMWRSDNYEGSDKSGSPSLANFDGMGLPEIAFGRHVYDASGGLVFAAGTGPHGSSGAFGPLSCVADLDGDDRPELIAGATVYTFTGTVGNDFAGSQMWAGTPGDGFCGVADFDGDGAPEVVTVNSNAIHVWHGTLGTQLATFDIPGSGAGGPPNIADFDGDGTPEIGTAAADFYVVVKFDGVDTMSLMWQANTKDGSSQRTGSSVFDFDGDGRSEVIYVDEWYLRIYPGTEPSCPGGALCDGVMDDTEVLFRDINGSRTRTEYPIVADVDGDFKAEIVVSTNNESDQGDIGDAGVEVFEDRLDNWVGTLPIWNQHTYHVTNVLADGTIPTVEPPNWSTPAADPHNSYRRNTQGGLETLCAPDLVPRDFLVDEISCQEDELQLSVKVVNEGCLGVGPGVNVAFFADGNLLGVVQTAVAIPAGGSTTVMLAVPPPLGPADYHVVVDDDGMGAGAFNECREENNATPPEEHCRGVG